MSDVPEGSGQTERGAGRRPPRVGDSGSPVGSTLSIVLAVVAVVVGFLILRSIFDEDDGGAAINPARTTAAPASETTVANTGESRPTTPPTTAVPKNAATVVVANASGVDGSASAMTTALEGRGYRMGEATDASGEDTDATRVLFVRGDSTAQGVAEQVANDMGGVRVSALRGSPPVEGGDIGNATVLVMLGTDLAGQPLPEPAVTAPPPATGSATTGG